jgi:hypothetical protein
MEQPPLEIFKYEQRFWYPHMSPAEAKIWHRFVQKYPNEYDTVAYDVKVGTIPDFILQSEDPAIRAQASNYQYKIDVVAFKDKTVDIIELKQSATFRSLGQVKSYTTLYKRDIDPLSTPQPVIITDLLLPDMEHLAETEGVVLQVV